MTRRVTRTSGYPKGTAQAYSYKYAEEPKEAQHSQRGWLRYCR